MRKYALLSISVLLFICMAGADSKKAEFSKADEDFLARKYSTTVELRIVGDKEIKNEVYSYISRELRALGDVREAKTTEAHWIIDIVALANYEKTTKRLIGFTLSVVILEQFPLPFDYAFLKTATENKLSENECEMLIRRLKPYFQGFFLLIHDHFVFVDDHTRLQELCQDVAIRFDAKHLKPDRELHEKLKKEITSKKKELTSKPKDQQKQ